ncbi:MAG: GC-type dockerin domain-anchored protein [Phycisphaerales bacterium]
MRHAMCILALAGLASAATAGDKVVSFANGAEGWSINGWTTPDLAGGNPNENLHWDDFVETFGLEIRTDEGAPNTDFVHDLTTHQSVTLSVDVKVNYIQFFGSPADRDLIVEIRDYDNVSTGYPYCSVWVNLGILPGAPSESGWTTYSATFDPNSSELPAGWGGYGDEDPNTFEPILPADRTFSDVLAGADQVLFTTYVPGFFYGFTNFNIQVDNIRIQTTDAGGCNGADLAEPFGQLDFSDVVAFLTAFGNMEAGADLAEPFGQWDFSDVVEFLSQFGTGCP